MATKKAKRGIYLVNTHLCNQRAHSYQILKTANALLVNGLKVEIVAPRYGSCCNAERLQHLYALPKVPQVRFVPMPGGFKDATLWSFVAFLVPVFRLLVAELWHRTVSYLYVRSEFFIPVLEAGKCFSVPYFYELHRQSESAVGEWVRRYMVRRACGVIVINSQLQKIYQRFNQNCLIAHDAVDVSEYKNLPSKEIARKELSLPQSQIIALYAGSVRRMKGVDVVIGAAESMPDVQFYLLGRVYDDIHGMDLPANVQCLGEVTHGQVATYLAAADILLLPHPAGIHSQSPMKLFEYMAVGTPIIASDLPYHREVLGVEGVGYFAPGDVNDFIRVINGLKARYEEMVSAAAFQRTRVLEYTWEKRGERIATFVDKNIIHA